MKKVVWIILFLLVLLTDLSAIYLNNEILKLIFKPVLMPLLAVFFLSQTLSSRSGLKTWIILALLFSWAGDILLMFEEKSSSFFLAGLSAFLVAHVFYIILFHNIRMKEYIRGNALFLLVVVVYYALLMGILSPHLGSMRLPVRIYGVVISFMLMLAMHTLLGKNKNAGLWMMIGAILFVTSDSLLAVNKFVLPFQYAGVLTLLTYGLAQLFIVIGAIKYLEPGNTG